MHRRKTPLLTLALLAALIVLAPAISARRITTKVDTKAMQAQGALARAAGEADTVRAVNADSLLRLIRLYGYDKPYDASRESVFISSSLSVDTVDSVRVRVQYMTMKGEGLHTRELTLPCRVPPGGSTRIIFPGWDATHTFYYHRTPPGRRQGLTPYTVLLTPLLLYLH